MVNEKGSCLVLSVRVCCFSSDKAYLCIPVKNSQVDVNAVLCTTPTTPPPPTTITTKTQ